MPTRRATVGSAVSGRVVEFPIEMGDRVEERQTLAQILTETIGLELAAAEAQLELRKQELQELENGSRPEEIEQAKAQLYAAQARNEYAQSRLKRSETLFQRGGVTEETLDEIRSLASSSQQVINEAEATYRLIQAGPRKEKIAQGRAQVAMQEAEVEKLKDQIKKYTVITRFAGYVVAEHTEAGAWVNQGDPVADIVALDEVDLEAYVPENSIPFVRVGEEVRVEIPALPDRLVTGKVISINPQADVRARTFPVLVRVKNEIGDGGPVIKAGMMGRAVLPTGPIRKTVLVPKDALVLGGQRPIVYVTGPDPAQPDKTVVRPVPVVPGVASGSLIEVDGELRTGQTVVTLGNERLRPGDAVQPATAQGDAK
ncbi:MAG: efflux RND transporter periplasmic adaptor subunit, partial [Planctomycetota bacterium]|nr:efflux RND transporter periplasmic adaptor subunit [Planctomycetota bacterium]